MGQLREIINIKEACEFFDIKNVVETGTGYGDTVEYVDDLKLGLNIHTIEYMPEIMEVAKLRLKDRGINFHLGYSVHKLVELLPELQGKGNTLFWLDAHFPGADFGLANYDTYSEASLRIPLQWELHTIASIRDISNDLFVIDDLRIYMDGPYDDGNWSERESLGGGGVEFIYHCLGETHDLHKLYAQQGYVIGWPKTKRSSSQPGVQTIMLYPSESLS